MTVFGDNIQTGLVDGTANPTASDVRFTKTVTFTGANNAVYPVKFPAGVRNIDASLYIETAGSAATTNTYTFTFQPGATLVFTSVGSATGIFRAPTITSAAAFGQGSTVEVSCNVVATSTDAASAGRLVINFNRR